MIIAIWVITETWKLIANKHKHSRWKFQTRIILFHIRRDDISKRWIELYFMAFKWIYYKWITKLIWIAHIPSPPSRPKHNCHQFPGQFKEFQFHLIKIQWIRMLAPFSQFLALRHTVSHTCMYNICKFRALITLRKFGKLSTSVRSLVDVGGLFFMFCHFDASTFLFRSTHACDGLFLAPFIYDLCMKKVKWSY